MILVALPAPGGLDAMERLPSIESLLPAGGGPIVDWADMPAACDPCRGGSLGADCAADADGSADADADVEGGACDSCGDDAKADAAGGGTPGKRDPDSHLPLTGRKKRWQARSAPSTGRLMAFEEWSSRGPSTHALSALSWRANYHNVEGRLRPNSGVGTHVYTVKVSSRQSGCRMVNISPTLLPHGHGWVASC